MQMLGMEYVATVNDMQLHLLGIIGGSFRASWYIQPNRVPAHGSRVSPRLAGTPLRNVVCVIQGDIAAGEVRCRELINAILKWLTGFVEVLRSLLQ